MLDKLSIDRQNVIHLGIIIGCIALVYGYSLSYGFVWDDSVFLVGNEVYSKFQAGKIFTSLANGLEYLPVRDLSFALDYAIWGANPFGFRLTNLFILCLSAVFIYFTASELCKVLMSRSAVSDRSLMTGVPFLTTLLFVVHPMNTEAICWVTGRNVLLSGLFFFISCLSFLVFLRRSQYSKAKANYDAESKDDQGFSDYRSEKEFMISPFALYTISFLAFILALFSKATSIMLPGILLLFVIVNGVKIFKNVLYLFPFFGVAGGGVYLFKTIATNTGVIADHPIAFGSGSFLYQILVAVQIPFFYLKKLFAPLNFSAEYTDKFDGMGDPVAYLALFVIIAIAVLAFLGRKRVAFLYLSLGLYIVALLPVLHFFPTNPIVADRYVFLPSFGIAYLVAFSLFYYLQRDKLKRVRNAIGALLVVTLAIISFLGSRTWKNDETLWLHAIEVSPGVKKAYFNIASFYFKNEDYEKAFSILEKETEITGIDVTLITYRGQFAFINANFEEAIEEFEKIAHRSICPMSAKFMLAQSYDRTGNARKAMDLYLKTLESKDYDKDGCKPLASQRVKELQMRASPELEAMQRMVEANPNDLNTLGQLGILYEENLLFDKAIVTYEKIVELGGVQWTLYFNLGNAYKKIEKYDKAVYYYEKSISLNNKYPDTYNNLGSVLLKKNDSEGAINAMKIAMDLDPKFKEAPLNLARIYFDRGDKENAKKYFNHVLKNFPELESDATIYLEVLK